MDTLLDPALALAADVVGDLEKVRIANQNRVNQLLRTEPDEDGVQRGFGLDPEHPDVMRLLEIVYRLQGLEEDAVKELQRKMRKHPLGGWVKAQKGIGEKQAARLLASLGDPYINGQQGTRRSLVSLWAYTGYHTSPNPDFEDPREAAMGAHGSVQTLEPQPMPPGMRLAVRRRKGERANWSTAAKTRAFLVAESCIKQLCAACKALRPSVDDAAPGQKASRVHSKDECTCSSFRVIYDQRRERTAVTNPDWTDGHSHNDGVRIVAKMMLKSLWLAAREWHRNNDPEMAKVIDAEEAERAAQGLVPAVEIEAAPAPVKKAKAKATTPQLRRLTGANV